MKNTIKRNEEMAQAKAVYLWAYEKCLETGKEYYSSEELHEAVNEGHSSPVFSENACIVALEKLAWPHLYRG